MDNQDSMNIGNGLTNLGSRLGSGIAVAGFWIFLGLILM